MKKAWYYLAAALLAVAAILKNKPYLAFKIPYVGWLVGGLIGYGFSPMFEFDALATCYDKQNCPWLKSGDVVVDVCAKCGTNWMMTVVHELRTWDQPELRDFRDVLDIAPWAELVPHPTANRKNLVEEWDNFWNNSKFKLREYKSHLTPYREKNGIRMVQVPVRERKDVKFLVMVRNPIDVLHSMSVFMPRNRDEWYEQWGNMPVPAATFLNTLFFVKLVKYMCPFAFVESWMEFAGEENVLILHYTNVFKDTKKHLKIIADFIGITDIPEEAFDEINDRVGIKHMKEKGDRYRLLAGVNKSLPMLHSTTLVRRGGFGASKHEVTEEEKLEAIAYGKSIVSERNFELVMNGFEAILNKKVIET